jgi:hypothetical protein
VQYLKESTEPNSLELLVMYYLQKARYVEAVRLNEKLKGRVMVCGFFCGYRFVRRRFLGTWYCSFTFKGCKKI